MDTKQITREAATGLPHNESTDDPEPTVKVFALKHHADAGLLKLIDDIVATDRATESHKLTAGNAGESRMNDADTPSKAITSSIKEDQLRAATRNPKTLSDLKVILDWCAQRLNSLPDTVNGVKWLQKELHAIQAVIEHQISSAGPGSNAQKFLTASAKWVLNSIKKLPVEETSR